MITVSCWAFGTSPQLSSARAHTDRSGGDAIRQRCQRRRPAALQISRPAHTGSRRASAGILEPGGPLPVYWSRAGLRRPERVELQPSPAPSALGIIRGATFLVERTSCPSVRRLAWTGKMPVLRRRCPERTEASVQSVENGSEVLDAIGCRESVFRLVPAVEKHTLETQLFCDLVIVVGVADEQDVIGWQR